MTTLEQRTGIEWFSDVVFSLFWLPETRRPAGDKAVAVDRMGHFQGTVEKVDVLAGLVEIQRTDGSNGRVQVRGSHMADTYYSESYPF